MKRLNIPLLPFIFLNFLFIFQGISFESIAAVKEAMALGSSPVVMRLGVDQSDQLRAHVEIRRGWSLQAPAEALSKTKMKADADLYPTCFHWEQMDNVDKVLIKWPPPVWKENGEGERIPVYTGTISIPLVIKRLDKSGAFSLKGNFKGLVCSASSCQPIESRLAWLSSEDQSDLEEQKREGLSLLTIFLFAFLGGVILNFMPCVLPVLGLKILAFSSHAAPDFNIRREFLMTAFGIYSCFLCIATLIVGLKAAGNAVGWGMHFQNPYFISGMCVAILLFTANLFDFFHVALPSRIPGFEGSLRLKKWKSFVSGVLSVLLATPCSAPFMGTAVGFALARNALDIFGVFFFLSTGFALPYLLGTFLHSHRLPLPKPGPWLSVVKYGMGCLLLGTLGWLLLLLSDHVSPFIPLVLCGIGFAGLWALRFHIKSINWITFLILIILGTWPFVGVYFPSTPFENTALLTQKTDEWVDYSPQALDQALEQGRTVFLDITASWCMTCQINKKVLRDPKVQHLIKKEGIILMRGDWTRSNIFIPPLLARFGRAAIPFNAVFGPRQRGGFPLSEILTVDDVCKALRDSL